MREKSYHILRFGIFVCLFGINQWTNAQLVINEVSSNNIQLISDVDNEYKDWFEIYNSGAVPINLANYTVTDDPSVPNKWTFPNYTLDPDSFLLVYASDKDRSVKIDHWEAAVYEDDMWRYEVPTVEPATDWNNTTFNDAGWALGKGGFGYGDGDDSTVLATPVTSVYIRKTFNITDISKLLAGFLYVDYDDGFVAYLNGVEIARSTNMAGTPPAFDDFANPGHEATKYSGGRADSFYLDYGLINTVLNNGTNVLAIQAHNTGIFSSDMTIRSTLTFGISDGSVEFGPLPADITLPSTTYHTNFKIKEGEVLSLYDNTLNMIDQVTIPSMKGDHSYGRQTDGNATWAYFNQPTPGYSNNSATSYTGYCTDNLTFSLNPGYYTGAQNVTITGSPQVRYTTDGSEPTSSATLYSGSINIGATTVLRAACVEASKLPGEVFTNTYFIDESSTLPVVSISTHPDNFFDWNTGIYEMGPNAEVAVPHFGANFWQDWEKPIHIEYFNKNGIQEFEQNAGIRIFGGWSRANPQKSLRLKADNKYGKDRFDHQFFTEKNIKSFKQVVLRNSGNESNYTHFQDGLNQQVLADKTAIDKQAFQPALVYINGQYWGEYNIREKINEYYVEENHGIDTDSVQVVDTWGQEIHGGPNNFWGIHWSVTNNNMSNQAIYEQYIDSFDLENYVDFFAANIYISNWDWPQNNLKWWRSRNDRKIRYIMFDTDITLGIWGLQPASFDQINRIRNTANDPHSEMFSSFLDNIAFRDYFINRSADLMNTVYTPSNFINMTYRIRDTLAPEMPRHHSRWPLAWGTWDNHINNLIDFMNDRPVWAFDQIESEFSLTKQVNVTLDVSPPGAGIIKLNTIYPETFPWTGIYYDGVPVSMTIIPNPGYTFSHWQSNNIITSPNSNKSITLNVDQNDVFTAYFNGSAAPLNITVSEVNYHSAFFQDAGDWLELHNYSTAAIDISGWTIKDDKDYHEFVVPDGTVIPADGYLVIVEDLAKFSAVYPSGVPNYIGPLGFSLNNAGEEIRIYDVRGDAYLSFTYDDQGAWPVGPDGGGYTLELSDPNGNLNDPANWFEGCVGGSPGRDYNVGCLLAVDEEKVTTSMAVYPNPSNGETAVFLNNVTPDKYMLKIVDVQGLVLQQLDLGFVDAPISQRLNLSQLASGMYFVVLSGEKSQSATKIIVN